jgi:biopolymer transport protein ExbB
MMPVWFKEGGVMMYPLLLCSIVSMGVILERFFSLNRIRKENQSLAKKVRKAVSEGQAEKAVVLCQESTAPISFIFAKGLKKKSCPKEEIEKAMEDEASHQVPIMEKFLPVLAIITGISPLIGFLGTVTGLYRAFMDIVGAGGVTSTSTVASGIAEALITTVAGLVIAIPTLIFHGYFISQVNTMVLEMERESMELIELLNKEQI